jgi:hypothetical protein
VYEGSSDPGEFRAATVAAAYAEFQGFPIDYFLDKPMILPQEGPPLVHARIERFVERGVFVRP